MLLLSIHPSYVDAILRGEKKVELRRRRPRIECGQALIYATSPRMELAGSFRVGSVVRAPLCMLWQSVRDIAGVSKAEFDSYFDGLDCGVAIHIQSPVRFRDAVPLDSLRAAWPGFQPPQGFRYVEPTVVAKLVTPRSRRTA